MPAAILKASAQLHSSAKRLETAYRKRQAVPDAPEIPSRINAWCRAVAGLASDPHVPSELGAARAEVIGRDLATILHVRFHAGFHAAFAAGADRAPPEADPREVLRAELDHRTRLGSLRRAAADGSLVAVARVLRLIFGPDAARLDGLCAAAGTTGETLGDGITRLRVSDVARRTAALAAGAVVLQRRLTDERLRTTTAEISAGRSVLTRDRPSILEAAPGFVGRPPGTRLAVIARVDDVMWVESPNRPHTRLALAGGSEIRVYDRDLRLEGLGGRHWVWAWIKVEEPDGGVPYAVADFERPVAPADTAWEDWLHVEARSAYDVAARSVGLVADFADLSQHSAPLDLYARTTGRAD
jgi:hypothetical protein